MLSLFVVLAIVFVGYALLTQYTKTPAEQPIPNRVWAAIVAAAASLSAAAMAWFQSGTAQ